MKSSNQIIKKIVSETVGMLATVSIVKSKKFNGKKFVVILVHDNPEKNLPILHQKLHSAGFASGRGYFANEISFFIEN